MEGVPPLHSMCVTLHCLAKTKFPGYTLID